MQLHVHAYGCLAGNPDWPSTHPGAYLSVLEVEVEGSSGIIHGAVLPLLDGQTQLLSRQVAQRARLELASARLQATV
jgi:hypothetical protein